MDSIPIQSDYIDMDLRYISLVLTDLRDMAPDWDEMNIGIKMGWEQEWRSYMHLFESLYRAYRAGSMNEDQRSRFLALQRDLEENASLIESLGLQRPPVLSRT